MKPLAFILLLLLYAPGAGASRLNLPPEVKEGLRLLYSGDMEAAIGKAREFQQREPEHPGGYLLEANIRWWRTYCAACEIRWNTIDAWERKALPEDEVYFSLCDRAIRLAEARIARQDSFEMRFYAGMGYALRARLHGLRMEKLPTARTGKAAREHLLRAQRLEPQFADALTGIGLYNYYADTLSVFVKILRVFIGIPGGDKELGKRQLERAMREGEYTAVEARVYLAKNYRNYEQQYERAAALMEPLVDEYPSNPIFHLLLGDFYFHNGKYDKAARQFRAAAALARHDSACADTVQRVAEQALARIPRGAATGAPEGR
jgi:tetratricopeptide (TPR) repeat protein